MPQILTFSFIGTSLSSLSLTLIRKKQKEKYGINLINIDQIAFVYLLNNTRHEFQKNTNMGLTQWQANYEFPNIPTLSQVPLVVVTCWNKVPILVLQTRRLLYDLITKLFRYSTQRQRLIGHNVRESSCQLKVVTVKIQSSL